jgi:hypothetical protein
MKLFRKSISETKSVLNDKAAGWIANGILKTQEKFANVLDKISNSWKPKQQWIFLYLVCLVFGGLSILGITKPFNKKTQNILSKPSAIKTPINIHSNYDLPSVIITDNEISQVHAFKHSLDSLSATAEGKLKVNKLLNQRPGLLDSLEMVEQLYYLQKK